MLSKILAFFLCLKNILSVGSIKFTNKNNITQNLSNKNQYGDYTFSFILENFLEIGGKLEITFPKQYKNAFTIASCKNTETCKFFENTISIKFKKDLFPKKFYSVTILKIRNPSEKTGSGNFYLKTKKGGNLIDENLIYPPTGIWKEIEELTSTTVAIDNEYSYAGETTKYIFSFKTPDFLPKNISVLILLPKNTFFVSEFPSCSSFAINGKKIKADLLCKFFDDKIEVTGFLEDLPKGSMLGILIRLGNPKYSLITDIFNIYVFKKGTNSAYFEKLNIKGVPISPGKINQISLKSYDQFVSLSKGKKLYLKLKFKLQNGLPEDSKIEIKLPNGLKLFKINNFTLDRAWSYFIESGLEDKSKDEILKMKHTIIDGFDILTLSNFKSQKTPGLISLVFLVDLPNTIGKTSSLEIKSMLQDNSEIDKNISDAFLFIDDISLPNYYLITNSFNKADGNTIIDLVIEFNTNKEISENSILKILVDSKLVLNDIDDNCYIWNDVIENYEKIQNCYTDDRYLILEIVKKLELGILKKIKIDKVFKSPEFSAHFHFEVSNIMDNKIIQSFGFLLYFFPADLQSLSSNIFPVYKNQKSIIDIKFVTPYDLELSSFDDENSILSFIQLEFLGTPITQKDLGMGIILGEKKKNRL